MNPLTRKLEHFVKLSEDDRRALDMMASQHVRERGARIDIIREGEKPESVKLLLQGWACRYKVMEDGRRQIVSFFVPGDICDLNIYLLREMDHSIGAITPVTYAQVSREAFEAATEGRTRIVQALWWDTLVSSAIQREWIANIGQRSALERIAHLLLELFSRLETVGLTTGDSCEMPITQTEFADALGMTAVHVNRMMQELRGGRLLDLSGTRLTILDREALTRTAQFNPNYLHLQREGRHLDANN